MREVIWYATCACRGRHLLVHDYASDVLKHLIHILSILGRCLEKLQSVILSKSLSFESVDDSVRAVGLVSNEDLGNVGVRVLVDLLEPVLDVVEGLRVSAIVDQDYPHGAFVVGLSYRAEPLLASRVPNLELHPLIVHVDLLDLEVDAYSIKAKKLSQICSAEKKQAA